MARKRIAPQVSGDNRQHLYLIQYTYTPQAWSALLDGDDRARDRAKAVDKLVQALGGCFPEITIPCAGDPKPREKFGTFGDKDVATLIAFPSDEAAAAFAMAIAAAGAVSSFKTTRLMTWDEMTYSMGLAAAARKHYQGLR